MRLIGRRAEPDNDEEYARGETIRATLLHFPRDSLRHEVAPDLPRN
jgi:hypothetical protein